LSHRGMVTVVFSLRLFISSFFQIALMVQDGYTALFNRVFKLDMRSVLLIFTGWALGFLETINLTLDI
jgi:hypothetical protein